MLRTPLTLCLLFLFCGSLVAQDTGTVTVIHGVPGVTVDVYVNGDLTLEDFLPETVTDPLELPAGPYDIDITLPDADISEAIITGSVELPAGANASIVAHLDAEGTPVLNAFVNDLSELEKRQGRAVVRHTAAAPEVDVKLYRFFSKSIKIEGLENPNEAQADIRGGFYIASVFLAGTRTRAIGPVFLFVPAGKLSAVYAIGSAADGTLGLVVQRVDVPEPEADTGLVTVVHGVPGLTVDVYLNGELVLEDFEPGTVTDEIELPAQDYDIAVTAAGDSIDNAVITGSVTLPGGANASVVAHLSEDGTPTLSVFVNDFAPSYYAGELVVRHTAAAPAVDVQVKRYYREIGTLTDLSNGNEAGVRVLPRRYKATIFPAGSDDAVAGPVKIKVSRRKAKIVYAIGSLADGSFGLLEQSVDLPRRSFSFASFFR